MLQRGKSVMHTYVLIKKHFLVHERVRNNSRLYHITRTLPQMKNGPPLSTIWQLVPVMVISHAVKLQHL